MKCSTCLVLLGFIILNYAAFSNGKKWHEFLKPYQSECSITSSSIGMPNHPMNGRLQPGFQLGLQKKLMNKRNFTPGIYLGYFAHQSLQRVVYLKVGTAYKFRLPYKFIVGPSLHVSMLNVRQTNHEFIFSNGKYNAVKRHSLQLLPGLGLNIQRNVSRCKEYDVFVLARYEFGMQFPFSQLSAILPINQFHIGLGLGK